MLSKNQQLIATVGTAASGKTTWAEQVCSEHPRFRNVNRDDIRLALYGRAKMYAGIEDDVSKMQYAQIRGYLSEGYSVIVSDTNLSQKYLNKIKEIGEEFGVVLELNDSFLKTPVEVCIERDSKREFPVGRRVIMRQAAKAGLVKEERLNYSGYKAQDYDLVPAYIFDVDGTLTEEPFERSPFDWHKVGQDKPNEPMINMLLLIAYCPHYQPIILSGRDSVCRQETVDWLYEHTKLVENKDYLLYMRPENDSRKDSIVKKELYETHIKDKFFVMGVFDDRKQVVELWRDELGLPCFQVAWGNF